MSAVHDDRSVASGPFARIGGRLCKMPFPIVSELAVADGTLLLLRCPVGVASPISLVKMTDEGAIAWVAEPCAWPPAHDPYVEAWVDGDRTLARSASGWVIELDALTGAGSLVGHGDVR